MLEWINAMDLIIENKQASDMITNSYRLRIASGAAVSGITPVNAANFVTKAYADGLTPGV